MTWTDHRTSDSSVKRHAEISKITAEAMPAAIAAIAEYFNTADSQVRLIGSEVRAFEPDDYNAWAMDMIFWRPAGVYNTVFNAPKASLRRLHEAVAHFYENNKPWPHSFDLPLPHTYYRLNVACGVYSKLSYQLTVSIQINEIYFSLQRLESLKNLKPIGSILPNSYATYACTGLDPKLETVYSNTLQDYLTDSLSDDIINYVVMNHITPHGFDWIEKAVQSPLTLCVLTDMVEDGTWAELSPAITNSFGTPSIKKMNNWVYKMPDMYDVNDGTYCDLMFAVYRWLEAHPDFWKTIGDPFNKVHFDHTNDLAEGCSLKPQHAPSNYRRTIKSSVSNMRKFSKTSA